MGVTGVTGGSIRTAVYGAAAGIILGVLATAGLRTSRKDRHSTDAAKPERVTAGAPENSMAGRPRE
jgi:hypothetical protein